MSYSPNIYLLGFTYDYYEFRSTFGYVNVLKSLNKFQKASEKKCEIAHVICANGNITNSDRTTDGREQPPRVISWKRIIKVSEHGISRQRWRASHLYGQSVVTLEWTNFYWGNTWKNGKFKLFDFGTVKNRQNFILGRPFDVLFWTLLNILEISPWNLWWISNNLKFREISVWVLKLLLSNSYGDQDALLYCCTI